MNPPNNYAVLLPNGTLAHTDDGAATAPTEQKAKELADWIANDYMDWDTNELAIVKIEYTPIDYTPIE